MVVQAGKPEHQHYADQQPAHLLHVHAVQCAAVGGGIDLDYTQGANSRQDGQQPPIVIFSTRCVLHSAFPSSLTRALSDFSKNQCGGETLASSAAAVGAVSSRFRATCGAMVAAAG